MENRKFKTQSALSSSCPCARKATTAAGGRPLHHPQRVDGLQQPPSGHGQPGERRNAGEGKKIITLGERITTFVNELSHLKDSVINELDEYPVTFCERGRLEIGIKGFCCLVKQA